MNTEKKFLIVRLSAIGDIVHSLTVADCLRTFYPNAQIDWVVSDKCRGLIENNPLINNVYVADISKWRKTSFFAVNTIFNGRNQPSIVSSTFFCPHSSLCITTSIVYLPKLPETS